MNLNQYKAATISSGAVMGWIVMLSMSDTLADRDPLVDSMNSNGFDGSVVPNGMTSAEAFRYATTRRNGTCMRFDDKDWTLMVRDVRNPGYLTKHLVVEAKDENLDYGNLGTISFSQETETVTTSSNPTTAPQEIIDWAVGTLSIMSNVWNRAVGTLDYHRVRKVLIGTLERELTGFQLHRSVWYVPDRHDSGLERMQKFIEEAGLPGVKLVLIPLMDTEKNRELVVEAFREQATNDYLALIERANKIIADVKSGRKVRAGTSASLMEEYKRQTIANGHHISDLKSDVDTLKATAGVAKTAIENAVLAVAGQ